MYILDSFFLAIALAMDAFAVSIILAYNLKNLKLKNYIIIASSFGLFQFSMPISGYFITVVLENSFNIANFQEYGAFVAFILLFVVGAKMVKEAFEDKEEIEDKYLSFLLLLTLSISTSLDALSVGVSFYLIQYPVFLASVIIGLVCFIISGMGLFIGKKLASNNSLGKRAELLGGVILIGIGIKILVENAGG